MSGNTVNELQEKIRFYETVPDNIQNGVIITDPDGKIIYFSKSYGNFLGDDPGEMFGKNCPETVEIHECILSPKQGSLRSTVPIELRDRIWWSSVSQTKLMER